MATKKVAQANDADDAASETQLRAAATAEESPELEHFAHDAVALDDDDIGLDTLRAVANDLLILYGALTNDSGRPNTSDVADFVALIRHRIELALVLAARSPLEAGR